MPLWFHPPPIPVDLGAPVYPSPLLYHPPPYLVDPRPCYGTPCTSQFPRGLSNPNLPPVTRSPPTIPQAPVVADPSEKSILLRLRKVREVEWDYGSPVYKEDLMADVKMEKSQLPRGTTVNVKIQRDCCCRSSSPSLAYSAAERIGFEKSEMWSTRSPHSPRAVSNPERGRHGHGVNLPSMMSHLRAEIAAEVSAQSKHDKEKEARIREEVRAEIRQELERENREAMRGLAEREVDIGRRLSAIKEKENNWIQTYGKGILKGAGDGGLLEGLISTPASEILFEIDSDPETEATTEIPRLHPTSYYNPEVVDYRFITPIFASAEMESEIFPQAAAPEVQLDFRAGFNSHEALRATPVEHEGTWVPGFWPAGSYVVDETSFSPGYEQMVSARPPAPTVCTISSGSSSDCSVQWHNCDDSGEDAFSHIEALPDIMDAHTRSLQANNTGITGIVSPREAIEAPEVMEHRLDGRYLHPDDGPFPIQHCDMPEYMPADPTGQPSELIDSQPQKSEPNGCNPENEIIITISRSFTSSSTPSINSGNSRAGSEAESVASILLESLHKTAAEYEPKGKRVHWEEVLGFEGITPNIHETSAGLTISAEGREPRRRSKDGREREFGIVEPALRRRY